MRCPPAGVCDERLIREGHQFQRPSITTVAGTNSVLTKKVSIKMPIASPAPMSVI